MDRRLLVRDVVGIRLDLHMKDGGYGNKQQVPNKAEICAYPNAVTEHIQRNFTEVMKYSLNVRRLCSSKVPYILTTFYP